MAQILFGLLAGMQFVAPDFLYNVLDFNVNRMVHINAMIVWMLYGFIGSVYWLVEDESGVPLVGAKLANLNFWIFTTAVVVVVLVYLFVQVGPGDPELDLADQRRAASISRRRAGPTSASWCAS